MTIDLNQKFNDIAWEVANTVDKDRAYVGNEIQAIILEKLKVHSDELACLYHHERQRRDDVVFGVDQQIYCSQHLRPHNTGWCTVDVNYKVGLGIPTNSRNALEKAADKCRMLGLRLDDEGEPKDWIARARR